MKVKAYKELGFLVVAALELGAKFAYYLYRDDEVLERRPYTDSSAAVFRIVKPGKYQVKVFMYSSKGELNRGWAEPIGFQIGDLGLRSVDFEFSQSSEEWSNWVDQLKETVLAEVEPWYLIEPTSATAESVMESGWVMNGFPPLRPTKELDWGEPGRTNRSWGFHLHSWEFIDPVLKKYRMTGDSSLLDWMYDAAINWWKFAKVNEDEAAMVWYDMALSLRIPRLSRLLILLSKSEDADRANDLFDALIKHAEMLYQPDAFNSYNNHGFFAAAATVELSKFFPFIPWAHSLEQVGYDRMRIMVDKQFAADGGHLEHSPEYHRMLLDSFEKALADGLIRGEEITRRIRLASNVLGWMVQPDGKLVQLGDSEAFDVDANDLHSLDSNSEFILSNGRRGYPTEEELCVLPESGYVFVRSPQPKLENQRLDSGYLAFQGGFHSRAHKHADDLSFTWFDLGREILVDSGRFGYAQQLPADAPERKLGFYYGAPERMYVESTVAHNTVEVDGKDIERRRRRPYGSALGECTQSSGKFVIRGTAEFESYIHDRMISYEPGTSLEVMDTVTPKGQDVSAVSWFNVDGNFNAKVDDGSVLFESGDGSFNVRVTGEGQLIAPVRGQESPMRGWRSKVDREIVPVWNFGFKLVDNYRNRQRVFFEIVK